MNRPALFRHAAFLLLPFAALCACTRETALPSNIGNVPAASSALPILPAALPDSKRLESRLTGEATAPNPTALPCFPLSPV